jgi:hypothetical protein
MSAYGLIKATNLAMRLDSIADLTTVNNCRIEAGFKPVAPLKPSVRSIENCVALAIFTIPTAFPVLIRGEEFYRSLVEEISDAERRKWYKANRF